MSAPAQTPRRGRTRSAPSNRPIFVVACARSGTTLLQLMLHAHPRIAIPPETRFLIPLYEQRARFGDLTQKPNRRKVARLIVRRPSSKFRNLGLDPGAVMRRIVKGPPTIGSAAALVYQSYARRHGKQRWGDKRPAYILHLDMILELFPDAQIVHIVRDGRDCVSSLKRMRWWTSGSVGAIWYWRAAMRAGAWARATLPADQYHELYYESLVANPEAELRRLCDFLGEEFDNAMLAPHQVAHVAVPATKLKHHHARTDKPVDTSAVARWKEQLDPWEVNLMELVARRELERHGYQLATRFPVPSPGRLMAFARYAVRRRLKAIVKKRQRARTARTYTDPVASRLKTTR
ncbi:MAG: sulfotransferase [Nitriliruptorales bacterium]|nr:sulfotransferase [Nitriliruptorales bacterium]